MTEWSLRWWLDTQTLPGNIIPEIVISAAAYLVGRYHVVKHIAPFLRRQHQERIDQADRHHHEHMKWLGHPEHRDMPKGSGREMR